LGCGSALVSTAKRTKDPRIRRLRKIKTGAPQGIFVRAVWQIFLGDQAGPSSEKESKPNFFGSISPYFTGHAL
jgi:hypothetical protein